VPQTSPFIFLSHSGSDTDRARELKSRLEAAPDSKATGLKVWFDKDNLRPGAAWQPQIEAVITNDATAFIVYVGSRRMMNWVEAEVRVALSRATTDKSFLFIPVLAAGSEGASALPPFARIYQGVRDPIGEIDEFAKLLKAVLKLDWNKAVKFIDEPFVGLRSMREEEADRFFGRDKEVEELAEKLRRQRIVAIVADSGTGKSSLAEAGFITAFRGGRLADPRRSEPDDRIWHVVSMRPGTDPEQGLATGITETAEKLGRTPEERKRLWDAASGRALATLAGHDGQIHSAAFSPDGARIVTASFDNTTRIWDVSAIPKGNILQVTCTLLRLHEDPVTLDGVTDYPLAFDRPICLTDPPPPDHVAEPAAAKAGP